MKVLAVAIPGAGHLNPLLPLVRALSDQGDAVFVACGLDASEAVERAGATWRTVGHGEAEWFATLAGRTRGQPGDGLAPERINHYFVPRLFGEIGAPDMVDDLIALGRELRPDLVVFETYALAGPLAARVLGVPVVHHLISPLFPPEVLELADDAVSPLWRSFGLTSPGHAGVYAGPTIEISPASLERRQVPGGDGLAMRPVPFPEPGPPPEAPPRIYMTLGTFFSDVSVFRAVFDGLAGDDLEVVATVGPDQDPEAVGAIPANARVERFIPQADLLPTCAAVIHHGGAGTMYGCLAHGLPQIVIPQGADNFVNADLVAQAGAGVAMAPAGLTPAAIGEAVRRVLNQPAFASAARVIAGEMAAMPSPEAVAALLSERFAP